MIVSIGVAVAGTTSYAPDRDLVLTGACVSPNAACTAIVSTVAAVTSATTIVNASYNVIASLTSSAGGAFNLKFPVKAREVIYIAFSALGWIQLYFDEVSS